MLGSALNVKRDDHVEMPTCIVLDSGVAANTPVEVFQAKLSRICLSLLQDSARQLAHDIGLSYTAYKPWRWSRQAPT